MGIESFLLPAGIALSAALIWTAAFKGTHSRSFKSTGPQITSQQVKAEHSSAPSLSEHPPKGVQSQSVQTVEPIHVEQVVPTALVEPMQIDALTPSAPVAEPVAEETETPVIKTITPVTNTELPEAPAPFEEPQTAYTNPTISSTPLPTDVNAVNNISNPVEGASPALVIARPKRTRRARKVAADGTPKRRRTTRAKPSLPVSEIPAAETQVVPGQQTENNQ